jgi:uncharacterized UBP type Zn finger protein
MPGTRRHGVGRADRRPCGHVAAAHPVETHSTGCLECLAGGDDWTELWLCLSCGWVACSDDSPSRHARAHYEETDHPIAVPLRLGPQAWWCYVHQRAV